MSPRRLRAGLAAAATIGLGLAVHEGFLPLGPFADKAGDALYALMAYWLLVVLFPARAPRRLALLAFVLCGAIELSQLFHADWLDALRRTPLGGLVLGHGFDWVDGVAYALGAVGGAALGGFEPLSGGRDDAFGVRPAARDEPPPAIADEKAPEG